MNPYESPSSVHAYADRDNIVLGRGGPVLIAAILVLAVCLGILAQLVPSVRAFAMPRFGWVGLILCLNPLMFLIGWLRTPTRSTMNGAAGMMCALGGINAALLIYTGTVTNITNEFTERLHSSWFWSVVPFGLAGSYLFWYAAQMPSAPTSQEISAQLNSK